MPGWIQQAPNGVTSGLEVIELLQNITNWLFAGFLVVAAVFVILAAWQFISSGGDPQGVAQARQKLLWAAVAIAVAVFAQGIVAAIRAVIVG